MKKAFTLAEVLITLGIIGVIASLTIPALISEYKVKATVTQLKKINSTLSNAFMYMKENEYGGADVESWGNLSDDEFNEQFAKNLNAIDICAKGQPDKCFNNIQYTNLNGTKNMLQFKNYPGIVLGDGTVIATHVFEPEYIEQTGIYGQIFTDINGPKAPNVLGKDVFSFIMFKDKIVPRGLATETNSQLNAAKYCSKTNGYGHNGLGCTAWIIYNENMDYLKCEGLSWNGKTSCN